MNIQYVEKCLSFLTWRHVWLDHVTVPSDEADIKKKIYILHIHSIFLSVLYLYFALQSHCDDAGTNCSLLLPFVSTLPLNCLRYNVPERIVAAV